MIYTTLFYPIEEADNSNIKVKYLQKGTWASFRLLIVEIDQISLPMSFP